MEAIASRLEAIAVQTFLHSGENPFGGQLHVGLLVSGILCSRLLVLSDGLQPTSNALLSSFSFFFVSKGDDLQPTGDGLQPSLKSPWSY